MHCRGQIPQVLGAARHSSGNVQKAWKFLVFLHGRPLRTAHGFLNPLIVSQNPLKTVGKQANPAFLGTQMVTVPWPCIGDTSGESWIPNAESSKTVENKGFLRLRWNNLQWSLTTANCLSKSAHSSPETFKTVENKQIQHFWERRWLRFLGHVLGTPPGNVGFPLRNHQK